MSPEEMRVAIEAVYRAVLKAKKPGVRFGAAVPEGMTPLSWHLEIPATAEALTAHKFRVQFGDHAGEELANMGLSYGCTRFARLIVRDREEAQVKGHMKTHMRPRVFIVHALGWKGDTK